MKMTEQERLFAITEIERPLWATPGVLLGGMDEVGRGPLAGPVVAACVMLPPAPPAAPIAHVKDSKQLAEKRRRQVCEEILAQAEGYALGWVEPTVIDEINILQATRLAFKQAYEGMQTPPTDVLVDALRDLDIPARQHAYIHGDAISYLIAAASIVAKVARDAYMIEQDAIYPAYGFARNKGYGTAEHLAALWQHGPCPLHRRSFLGKILQERGERNE